MCRHQRDVLATGQRCMADRGLHVGKMRSTLGANRWSLLFEMMRWTLIA